MSGKVYGPRVRWFNPLRVRTSYHEGDGWTAVYRHRDGSSETAGHPSRQEALDDLRHFVTMRVQEVDGKWIEVTE